MVFFGWFIGSHSVAQHAIMASYVLRQRSGMHVGRVEVVRKCVGGGDTEDQGLGSRMTSYL